VTDTLPDIPGEFVEDFTREAVVVQVLEDYEFLSVIIEHEGKLYLDHAVDYAEKRSRWLIVELDFKDWMQTAHEYVGLMQEVELSMALSKAVDVGELTKSYLRGLFDSNKHQLLRSWIERQTGQFYIRDHDLTRQTLSTLKKIDKKDLPGDYLPVKE
jgi:hypothetical protein